MLFFRKIFSITTEVSRYLQAKDIDFIQAINLVDVAKKRYQKDKDKRCERRCNDIIDQTITFAIEKNLSERYSKPARLKNKISPILTTIISSIQNKFFQSREILNDLSLLSPKSMMSFKNENDIPDNAFKKILNWSSIDYIHLKN